MLSDARSDMPEKSDTSEKLCYVCLDECTTKSPCQCEIAMHPECLREIRMHYRACTVCKTVYEEAEEEEEEEEEENQVLVVMATVTFVVVLFVGLYILGGMIGQCLMLIMGMRPVVTTPATFVEIITSAEFVVAAILFICIAGLVDFFFTI